MRTKFSILAAFLLVAVVSVGPALALDYGITVYTDKSVYVQGQDNLLMSVSGFNNAADMQVDVHIAVLPPGGGIYEVPDWNGDFRPLLSNVMLPTGFNFPKLQLASYALTAFPFAATGNYLFAAAFTQPETLNFVGDISFAPFQVQPGSTEGWTAGGCELTWNHWYDWKTDLTWKTDVSLGGSFLKYAQKPDYYLDYYALPLDTCKYVVYQPLEDTMPTFLDAGDHIDMNGGPKGTYRMDRDTESSEGVTTINYAPGASSGLTESDYVVGDTYQFVGYGGPDVGDFSVSVQAPQVLEVNSPDISSRPTIDRSSDLHLSWNGMGQGYVLFLIGFEQVDISSMSYSYNTCYCRFSDDGDATVPASVLSQMPDYSNPFGILPPPMMTIERMNVTDFSATGLQNGYVVALAGITRDVQLN